MESGDDFEAAVDYAKQIGIAEDAPTAHVDGWDAATSGGLEHRCAWGSAHPAAGARGGIGGISTHMLQAALATENVEAGVPGGRTPGRRDACVQPQRVSPRSPLYSVTEPVLMWN
jgi:homoserine dehydrogenase